MRTKNTLYFGIILLTALWACNAGESPESFTPNALNANSIPENCIERDEAQFYKIINTCAEEYIQDYEAYVVAVKDSLSKLGGFPNADQKLVYGAKVDLGELKRLLEHELYQNYDSLYIMMGMIEGSTELLFALQANNGDNSAFFDFTLPCPTACPKLE